MTNERKLNDLFETDKFCYRCGTRLVTRIVDKNIEGVRTFNESNGEINLHEYTYCPKLTFFGDTHTGSYKQIT